MLNHNTSSNYSTYPSHMYPKQGSYTAPPDILRVQDFDSHKLHHQNFRGPAFGRVPDEFFDCIEPKDTLDHLPNMNQISQKTDLDIIGSNRINTEYQMIDNYKTDSESSKNK